MGHSILLWATLLAALGAGLVAGIFFAFSSFVMAALARRPPAEAVAAMQAINVTVLNGWFFTAFFGTAGLALGLAAAGPIGVGGTSGMLLAGGGVLYLGGTIGVTMILNVPLNEALDRTVPGSEEANRLWARYLTDWTYWNHVRTVAAFVAAALFTLALARPM